MTSNHLNYYYDVEADVFYLTKGAPKITDLSEEVDEGVIVRMDHKTHQVRGFTILNLSRRVTRRQPIELPFQVEFGVMR